MASPHFENFSFDNLSIWYFIVLRERLRIPGSIIKDDSREMREDFKDL